MTRFLFERQQQADGSMPRNSLTNGKPAPDSFNTQLDECAYPLGHGARRGPHRQRVLQGPHRAGRELRGQPRPVLRPGALGGAERLLALDDLGGDRRARRRGDHRRPQRRPRLRTRVARRRRRVSAQPQEVDADHQRAAERGSLLHPPLQERRPNAALTYNVGNGGPTLDQRAIIDAGFLEYALLGLLSANDADIIASLPVVDATISARRPAATASCATTATATATARATATRGRPPTWAPAIRGRCSPASAGSTRSTAAR